MHLRMGDGVEAPSEMRWYTRSNLGVFPPLRAKQIACSAFYGVEYLRVARLAKIESNFNKLLMHDGPTTVG
jgi:hypothetical protein